MPKLLLATGNAGKLKELRELTADQADWDWIGLSAFPDVTEAVEDGDTFHANACKKALHYGAASGLLTMADDSGLEVDALDGAPGVHSAYYAGLPRSDANNNAKLIEALRDVAPEQRTARFRCVIVVARDGEILAETSGTVEGRIVDAPRGTNGFGYDPHFFIPEKGCTTAELPPREKNAISHRGHAVRAMLPKLATLLRGA